MKQVPINNIATILTGYTVRKIPPKNAIKWKLLQGKDVGDQLVVDNKITGTAFAAKDVVAQLKPNDVVLTSRNRFKASIIQPTFPILASSSMYIIRINDPQIDPRYVAIYLNSNSGQAQLIAQSTGGSIPSLLRGHIQDVMIPLPPLKHQQLIVQLYQNLEKQKVMLYRKIDLITNLTETIVLNETKS